jgi:hypothetical protein
MGRSRREQHVEFVCVGTCEDPPTYVVEGRFNYEGEFEPTTIDETGSDMDCPECGERGEPVDNDVRAVDA